MRKITCIFIWPNMKTNLSMRDIYPLQRPEGDRFVGQVCWTGLFDRFVFICGHINTHVIFRIYMSLFITDEQRFHIGPYKFGCQRVFAPINTRYLPSAAKKIYQHNTTTLCSSSARYGRCRHHVLIGLFSYLAM